MSTTKTTTEELAGSENAAWRRLAEAHAEALVPDPAAAVIAPEDLKAHDPQQPYESPSAYFDRVAKVKR